MLVVRVGTDHPHSNTLCLRITVDYRHVLTALVDGAGIHYSDVLELSATNDLLYIYAVSAGSLTGLAAVLRALFERHAKKEFMVTLDDGVVVEAKGFSKEETLDLLKQALEAQQELDRRWDESGVRRQPPNLES
jgi:hypothetical protein